MKIDVPTDNAATQICLGPPPLRIHHLMTWMAVTAVLISVCLWFDRTARNGPPIGDPLVIAGLVLLAVSAAAALTCGGYAVYWGDHGIRFAQDPGDFLILHAARCIVFFVVAFLGIFVVFAVTGGDDMLGGYYVLITFIALILWLRSTARGFVHFADSNAWRIAFAALIMTPGIVLAAAFVAELPFFLSLVPLAACLLFAVYHDLRQRKQRSWTHWLGCFTTMALGLALSAVFHD